MTHLYQLQSILKASGWSQEQLAQELGVSFVSLNAWLNSRSQPRAKALGHIERLYLQIVGSDTADEADLIAIKKRALGHKLTARQLIDNQTALDTLTLYLTYHTNTIEGSTMTLSDVEDVLFEHKVLSNRTAIEQTEARNHQAALYWLLDKLAADSKNFVVDEQFILDLHVRLMNGIISNAGQYRNHSVRIMGAHVSLANWQKITELMQEFTANLKASSDDPIQLLAESHAVFEKIHPFSDGNGRTGRLLLLAQALSHGLVPPLVLKERKAAYYKYLEIAQTSDNPKPLEMFVADAMSGCAELLKIRSK